MSPGRRTNRKNFRTCQRTRLFLLLLFLESNKKTRFYPLKNQASAARSQGHDEFWCMAHAYLFSRTRLFARFSQFYKRLNFLSLSAAHFLDVEMSAERRNHAELSLRSLPKTRAPQSYLRDSCVVPRIATGRYLYDDLQRPTGESN